MALPLVPDERQVSTRRARASECRHLQCVHMGMHLPLPKLIAHGTIGSRWAGSLVMERMVAGIGEPVVLKSTGGSSHMNASLWAQTIEYLSELQNNSDVRLRPFGDDIMYRTLQTASSRLARWETLRTDDGDYLNVYLNRAQRELTDSRSVALYLPAAFPGISWFGQVFNALTGFFQIAMDYPDEGTRRASLALRAWAASIQRYQRQHLLQGLIHQCQREPDGEMAHHRQKQRQRDHVLALFATSQAPASVPW